MGGLGLPAAVRPVGEEPEACLTPTQAGREHTLGLGACQIQTPHDGEYTSPNCSHNPKHPLSDHRPPAPLGNDSSAAGPPISKLDTQSHCQKDLGDNNGCMTVN